jgi:uncharacterized protein DUF1877
MAACLPRTRRRSPAPAAASRPGTSRVARCREGQSIDVASRESSRIVLAVPCRGYFLALDEACTALVLAQHGNDDRLIETIKELDMTDAPDECGVDKAWDGIHRCLTDGRLEWANGSFPLNAVILGGLSLHRGDRYLVSYNDPARVRAVAAALGEVDWMPLRDGIGRSMNPTSSARKGSII